MSPVQVVVKWIQGTNSVGKTVYVNCNMVASMEQYNVDEFVLRLAGGGMLYLKGCTAVTGYPPFPEEEEV